MKKVLFVCVENARRSQMAEALLNKLAEGQAKGPPSTPLKAMHRKGVPFARL